MVGHTISHYRVVEKLGEGGMGVVYKAEDSKLQRTVAVKFLVGHLLSDAEARQRFLREARAAAALNHANICHVYEIDEAGGKTFLSMAFIEGEPLETRIERGPLPLMTALDLGRQIAEGLAAAHEKGVVHRDIKPANVMVDAKGHATIMDFGLARLTEASRLTKADTTMGTVAYMSPEQSQGAVVDHRTDIWALGCILYEMVSGQRAFQASYDQALVYSILNEAPEPLTGLRTGVPVELELLVEKCLAKDAGQRYQSASDLMIDIDALKEKLKSGRSRILSGTVAPSRRVEGSQIGLAGQESAQNTVRLRRERVAWTALVAVLAVLLAAVWLQSGSEAPPAPLRKFAIEAQDAASGPVISPNGRYIAYSVGPNLWLRDLQQLEPLLLREDAYGSFWSPDSRLVGFVADGQLWKMAVSGGAPIRLCRVDRFFGGAWSPDGQTIVFSVGQLEEVSSSGGEPKPLIVPERDIEPRVIASPHFLPVGERRLLAFRAGNLPADSRLFVRDLDTSETVELAPARDAAYSPAAGFIYSDHQERPTLWNQAFSPETMKATGEAVPIALGAEQPSVSADGTLVYSLSAGVIKQRLAWRSRSGQRLESSSRLHPEIQSFDMSPDGRRAVLAVQGDIFVEDLERGVSTQLTFTEETEAYPVWTPWGALFGRRDKALYVRSLDRTGEIRTFLDGLEGAASAYDVDPSGRRILYGFELERNSQGERNFDIYQVERGPDGALSEPQVFLADPFTTVDAVLSPDGRYVAYSARVTGAFDVFVQPFPEGGKQIQITPNGGAQVRWNPNGKELFFVSEDALYSAPVSTGQEFRAGAPRELFRDGDLRSAAARPRYDVSPDGERFLLIESASEEDEAQLGFVVIQNWYEEFRDREQE
jgi:Tol biopolymer transport system component/tRNA A-37 threonylcarbamoyl transferase component Bud32